MPNPTLLYHRTSAPTGAEFDADAIDILQMAKDGWVDSAAKLGVNMWDSEGSEVAVAQAKSAFEAGIIRPIDEPGQPSIEYASQMAESVREAQALSAQVERLKTILTPEQLVRYQQEMEADLKSDAAKLTRGAEVRDATDPSPTAQQLMEQAEETKLEQQRMVEEEEREALELAAQQKAGQQPAPTDI